LFQRFYRGDPARPRPRGIGLGLAISNELVRLHEGTIFVSSELNRGTTFRVELPA
jgi:signal transduction histidine kinase